MLRKGSSMVSSLIQKLQDKSITREQLLKKVKQNNTLIPELINGISSLKPAIRYGCAKILMDLSEEQPEKLYPYMDFFIRLLESKYRILTWNALITLANLTKVDTEKKFDSIFNVYFSLLDDEYMVTVANVVGNSGKIALAKPYLIEKITEKLLQLENLSTMPHLTTECKRVIIEHAIKSFDLFYPQIQQKENVLSFVKKYLKSSRKSLKKEAEGFLKRWG
jgi:hypothetical protein